MSHGSLCIKLFLFANRQFYKLAVIVIVIVIVVIVVVIVVVVIIIVVIVAFFSNALHSRTYSSLVGPRALGLLGP